MLKKMARIRFLVCGLLVLSLCGCGKQESADITNDDVISSEKENTIQEENENTFNVNVGGYVTFGSYEQDGDISNGVEEIEWRVLAVEDGKALLVSKYILDWRPYHEVDEDISWGNCGLKVWLNGEFYTQAFDSDEENMIVDTTITTKEESSINQVFILNETEVGKYFYSKEDRICEPTEVVKDKAKYDSNLTFENAEGCWYWCCAKSTRDVAPIVSKEGTHDEHFDYVDTNSGIRPAIWISVE